MIKAKDGTSSDNEDLVEWPVRKPEGWWWIDFIENEIDPALEKDLELLLEHSQEDRDAFENFRLLKEWLVGSDPIGDWPLDSRLRKVRRNVMAAIEAMPTPGAEDSYFSGAEVRDGSGRDGSGRDGSARAT